MRALAVLVLAVLLAGNPLVGTPTALAQDAGPGLAGGMVIQLQRAVDSPVIGAAAFHPVTGDFTEVTVRVQGMNPGDVRVLLLRPGTCDTPLDVVQDPQNPSVGRLINPPSTHPQPPFSLQPQPRPTLPVQLITLIANDEGFAESTTTVPIGIFALTFTNHFIDVGNRTPDEFYSGQITRSLSCGNVVRGALFPGPIQIITPQVYQPLPEPPPALPTALPRTGTGPADEPSLAPWLPIVGGMLVVLGLKLRHRERGPESLTR